MSKLQAKYMPSLTSQPILVEEYVTANLAQGYSVGVQIALMMARLIHLMAARNFLKAHEVQYIVTGKWFKVQYADWDNQRDLIENPVPSRIIEEAKR